MSSFLIRRLVLVTGPSNAPASELWSRSVADRWVRQQDLLQVQHSESQADALGADVRVHSVWPGLDRDQSAALNQAALAADTGQLDREQAEGTLVRRRPVRADSLLGKSLGLTSPSRDAESITGTNVTIHRTSVAVGRRRYVAQCARSGSGESPR